MVEIYVDVFGSKNEACVTIAAVPTTRDLRNLGEAMALLEAEADAIMQLVTRRREGGNRFQPAVEINIHQDAGEFGDNEPDSPHVPPPVHGSVGLGGQDGEVVAEGEASRGEEAEAPMETDKPGNVTSMGFVVNPSTGLNLRLVGRMRFPSRP